jgi:hypothetical protein
MLEIENAEDYLNIISERNSENLESIGKALRAIPTTVIENFYNDMFSVWEDLSDENKAELASSIAGLYNVSRFLTLMDGLMEIRNTKSN